MYLNAIVIHILDAKIQCNYVRNMEREREVSNGDGNFENVAGWNDQGPIFLEWDLFNQTYHYLARKSSDICEIRYFIMVIEGSGMESAVDLEKIFRESRNL